MNQISTILFIITWFLPADIYYSHNAVVWFTYNIDHISVFYESNRLWLRWVYWLLNLTIQIKSHARLHGHVKQHASRVANDVCTWDEDREERGNSRVLRIVWRPIGPRRWGQLKTIFVEGTSWLGGKLPTVYIYVGLHNNNSPVFISKF